MERFFEELLDQKYLFAEFLWVLPEFHLSSLNESDPALLNFLTKIIFLSIF